MNSSSTLNLESLIMNYDPLASFEPALARFLEKVRPCFKRDKTFGYLQKYMLGLMTDLKRKSHRAEHSSHRVDKIVSHSPTFYGQHWQQMIIKNTTRGQCVWHVKSAQVYLVKHKEGKAYCPVPTDRTYWLIVANNKQTGEMKYFISNAPVKEKLETLMEIAFSRWDVEKWFERAKQECGFGAFEVRTYTSLIRHWLASRLAMYFLADQATRLRGEKSPDNAGAGSRCGQYAGVEDLANVSVFMETESVCVRVLSKT